MQSDSIVAYFHQARKELKKAWGWVFLQEVECLDNFTLGVDSYFCVQYGSRKGTQIVFYLYGNLTRHKSL